MGRLVEPGELTERASPESAPDEAEKVAAAPVASSPRPGVDLFWPLVALAVAAAVLFLVVQVRRRRSRR